ITYKKNTRTYASPACVVCCVIFLATSFIYVKMVLDLTKKSISRDNMAKKYRIGQFVKVKITGIQSYGAFVKTPDNRDGLIHISEVMNDYVHDVNQYLSKAK